MAKKGDYRQYLKQTLSSVIDRLEISDLRREFLKNRWLDQVLWLEGKATQARDRHHRLRLVTIVGGVLVPAIVGFNSNNPRWQEIAGWTALGLSQAVAISAAMEEFFGHGDKYRNYRNTAEGLKIEGWEFFQMAGPYAKYKSHAEAYTAFAERVEHYISKDVESYLASMEARQQEGTQKAQQAASHTDQALVKLNQQLQRQAELAQQEAQRAAQAQAASAARTAEGPVTATADELQAADAAAGDAPMDKPIETLAEAVTPTPQPIDWRAYGGGAASAAIDYVDAAGIRARVKQNPLGSSGLSSYSTGAAGANSGGTTVAAPAAQVTAVMMAVPNNLKAYAKKSVPLVLKECAACGVTDPAQIAYIFATSEHESHLGQWMVEFASGKAYEGRRDLGNTQPGDGVRFKGRGFCQVTGRANYKMWSQKLGIDLVGNPEKAADEAIAARVMVMGMRDGSFTGKKLSSYISGGSRDFRNARRIINAMDRADHIAAIAERYYAALI